MSSMKTCIRCGWLKPLMTIVMICVSGLSLDVYAGDHVEEALKNLATALQHDPNLAPETKKALSQVIEALESERAVSTANVSVKETAPAPKASSKPMDEKFSFSGDFRLRHESNVNLDTAPDRHRQRVRLRLGGKVKLDPEFTVGARLVTGNPDAPTSTHQTLGNEYDSFEVSLDRVYLNYAPEWLPNGWATAGKFGDPFMRNPVLGGLVWDGDVQPEGLALGYTFDSVPGVDQVKLTLGEYIQTERSREDNAYVTAGQLSIAKSFNEQFSGNAAVGYYSYSDADLSDQLGNNNGNALVDRDNDGTPDAFASDFGIINPIASLTYKGWKKPLTVSGEYLHNIRANVSEDTGWAIGAALGSAKKQGNWKAYYQWQKIEQDAVFSMVAQDDFLFSTNFSGHVLGSQYMITDAIQLHLWALISERDQPDESAGQTDQSQWRLRSELNIKF